MADEAAPAAKKGSLRKIFGFVTGAIKIAAVSFAIAGIAACSIDGGFTAAATLGPDTGFWDLVKSVYGEAGTDIRGLFGGVDMPDLPGVK